MKDGRKMVDSRLTYGELDPEAGIASVGEMRSFGACGYRPEKREDLAPSRENLNAR
jgi:hypothetical protein